MIEGKEVEYRTLDEMMTVRKLIKQSLGQVGDSKRRYATFFAGILT